MVNRLCLLWAACSVACISLPSFQEPRVETTQAPTEDCIAGQANTTGCTPRTADPNNPGSTPDPTPSSAGVSGPGTVTLMVTGVLAGSTLSVALSTATGNTSRTSLTNGSYDVGIGSAGQLFGVAIAGAGPGLSCSASPLSGTLAATSVPVSIVCVRALNFAPGSRPPNMVVGQPNFTTPGAGTGNGLDAPRGVAVGPGGRLYISDSSNSRVVFGMPQTTAWPTLTNLANPTPAWSEPHHLSVNAAGVTAVADAATHQVFVYSMAPDAQTLPAVTLGGGGPGTSERLFNGPTAAFVTPDGRLLVADRGNNRVLIYANGADSNAGASLVLGQMFMTSSNVGCSPGTMTAPEDVWSDGRYIAVADTGNHRVLVWKAFPTTPGQNADVMLGQASPQTGCAAGGMQNQMRAPRGLVGDANTLFVADTGNHRILAFAWSQLQTNMPTAYVLGQQTLTSTGVNEFGVNPTNTSLNSPEALSLWNSSLVVADTANNRVLLFPSQ